MADAELDQIARARLGRVLRGKYRLDRVLGVGGMAVVYAATHRNKKRFAIKMLHPELSIRENIRTRFLREGYVANSVEHPGAVAVLDDDVAEDGSAFVVMELLDGSPIDAVCAKHDGRVPLGLTLSIGDALLDVLAAAHAKGVVHRDIKPANLFLTDDGRLEVLDFGIARLHDATSTDATATGAMLGTPAYMAPEQALAESSKVDGQTDLWAAGATLFAMLTGQLVHPGENASQLLVNAATKQARGIGSVADEVPKSVAQVIDKALAFEKKDRWLNAKEMRDALAKACLESTGAPIAPLPKTVKVTGLEETMASDPNLAQPFSASSGVGFDPTVDGRSPSGASSNVAPSVVAPKSAAQNTGSAVSQTKASIAPSRRPPWPRVALAIGALAIVGAGVAFLRGPSRSAATSTTPASSASAPRPGRPPATPAAAAAFEAALQAQHDGNELEMERNYNAAVASDPALGAVHLRLAIYWAAHDGEHEAEAHAAYQKAREHRATLGDVDAALLDAWEPRFRDPPDREERTKRLASVAKMAPGDAFILTDYAECLMSSHHNDEAGVVLTSALAADPRFVPALQRQIELARDSGDDAKVSTLIDACLTASPSAIGCIQARMGLEYNDGRCADVKADARRILAIDPNSEIGYGNLADAMHSLGESEDAVAEAMHQADRHVVDPDKRRLGELSTVGVLALLAGDLRGAAQAQADVAAFASSRPALDPIEPLLAEIEIVLDEGDNVHARALIKAVRARIESAGVGERSVWHEGLLARQSLRAGAITHPQLVAEQARILELQRDDDRRRGGKSEEFQAWYTVYANGAVGASDAADALATLPKLGGADPHFRFKGPGGTLGMLYASAGRAAEALPLLESRVKVCWELEDILDTMRAWVALGVAREQTGDAKGAREAYEHVLARWGNAKPRSLTADDARARLAALAKKN